MAKACSIEIYAVGPSALERRQVMTDALTTLLMRLHQRVRTDDTEAVVSYALVYEALLGSISSIVTTRVGRGETTSLPELRQPLGDWLIRALEVM